MSILRFLQCWVQRLRGSRVFSVRTCDAAPAVNRTPLIELQHLAMDQLLQLGAAHVLELEARGRGLKIRFTEHRYGRMGYSIEIQGRRVLWMPILRCVGEDE